MTLVVPELVARTRIAKTFPDITRLCTTAKIVAAHVSIFQSSGRCLCTNPTIRHVGKQPKIRLS